VSPPPQRPGVRPRRRRPEPPGSPPGDRLRGLAVDVAIVVAAFLVTTALAAALGAANLGTAASFGQIAFGLALAYVLLRR
jgi:hypothetical protein